MTQNEHASWTEKIQNVQIFSFAGFPWLFYQYWCDRSTFFALNVTSSGHSHTETLFPHEDQNKVGLWHNGHFSCLCRLCSCHRLRHPNTKWQPQWLCSFDFHKLLIFNKSDCKVPATCLPLGSPLKPNTETRRQFRRMDNGPHVQYGFRCRQEPMPSEVVQTLHSQKLLLADAGQRKQKKLIKTRLWGPFPKML